jgi:hypothetical protein
MATNASNQRLSAFANPLSKLEPSWRNALQTPAVTGLLALLLVQLVVALVLAGQGISRSKPDEPLLGVAPQQVSVIEIIGNDATLRLQRSADGWVLPDLAGFPADAGKVDQLLTTLSELPRTLPVAASAEARQRLKVADENAATRIKLLDENGALAELLTGDSPGFRRLYGRLAGEDAVFDLPLAAFEVGSDSDDWVIRDRLRLNAEAITRVIADDWTLTRAADGSWQLGDDTGELDPAEVDALLRRIANLSYQGILGGPADASGFDDPALRLEITVDGGNTVERVVSRDGESGFLLQTGAEPFVYELSEYDLEGVLDLDPDSLRVADETAPDAAEATADVTSATADDAAPEDRAIDAAAQQPEAQTPGETAEPQPIREQLEPPDNVTEAPTTTGTTGDRSEHPTAPTSAEADAQSRKEADADPANGTSEDTPVPGASEAPGDAREQGGVSQAGDPADETAAEPRPPQTQPPQPPLPHQPYQQPYAPPQPPPWPPQGRTGQPPPAGWR